MLTEFSPPTFVWDVNDYRGVSSTVAVVCLVLSLSSLLARLSYRQFSKTLYLDDPPVGGLLIGIASRGLGLTIENVSPRDKPLVSMGIFVNFLFYFVATGCSTLSLAFTCKITVLGVIGKPSPFFWILPGAIGAIVLFGIIGIAVNFEPRQLRSAGTAQFASLVGNVEISPTIRELSILTPFSTANNLYRLLNARYTRRSLHRRSDGKWDIAIADKSEAEKPDKGFPTSPIRVRRTMSSSLIRERAMIPAKVLLCSSITPERLANDFTLHVWQTAASLGFSLLMSSLTIAIVVMGGALDDFDIHEQTDFVMIALSSNQKSPGRTKFSQTNSGLASGNWTTKVDRGDASSDQMPILPEGRKTDESIAVSRTTESSTEYSKKTTG
ncbi:hypothetical protein LTR37_009170 [Vermiconidia calcicola]|uniref:Uncharacterized protein n=1 Tax=Vermiconidia calcicola TaxID=1690605 RepID=A0ACC3N9J9_9PEZI|nr:hypothetical protein LTR37_009170 [Vermiconidia calcicola]